MADNKSDFWFEKKKEKKDLLPVNTLVLHNAATKFESIQLFGGYFLLTLFVNEKRRYNRTKIIDQAKFQTRLANQS